MSVKVILANDDDRVIRASELAGMMQDRTLKQVADELGVAPSTVYRALDRAGYRPAHRTWERDR